MRLRPSSRVAIAFAGLAVLLALGAVYPPLVTIALVLDALVAAAWLTDVIRFGKLGLLAPDPATAELVFAVDAGRLPRQSVALARAAARKLGALLVATEELARLDPERLVIFTDSPPAEAAPPEAMVVLLRAETELAPLLASLEQKLRAPA
jgi:hypothetical protein